MAEEDIVTMSVKEVNYAGIIKKVIDGKIKQVRAAEIIGISDRQVRRQVKRVKEEGIKGLIHRARGKEKRVTREKKEKVLKIYQEKYPDFGPTLASEKLIERDGIKVDHETLRRWLEEKCTHEWQRRKRKPHKKWRERKECFGEMVQMDGSRHDWLEGRGPEMTLMGYIDDATSTVYARFYNFEGTIAALDSQERYIEKYGVPQSIYIDRHSTYKVNINKKQTIGEELLDKKVLTQFGRAMEELGVEVIYAGSAQAKGRIENLFGTFQDRLIKEMRLAGIKTMEEANEFLDIYLPKFNKQFSVEPKNPEDIHCPNPGEETLDRILCIKKEHIVRKDSTIQHKSKHYLLTKIPRCSLRVVIVEERLDGTICINHKGKYLEYLEIEPSVKVSENKLKVKTEANKNKKGSKKAKNKKAHPWMTYYPERHLDPCDFEEVGDVRELVGVK